ncbi:hypothetical protein PS15p_201157 [Mucor circinelloides]
MAQVILMRPSEDLNFLDVIQVHCLKICTFWKLRFSYKLIYIIIVFSVYNGKINVVLYVFSILPNYLQNDKCNSTWS